MAKLQSGISVLSRHTVPAAVGTPPLVPRTYEWTFPVGSLADLLIEVNGVPVTDAAQWSAVVNPSNTGGRLTFATVAEYSGAAVLEEGDEIIIYRNTLLQSPAVFDPAAVASGATSAAQQRYVQRVMEELAFRSVQGQAERFDRALIKSWALAGGAAPELADLSANLQTLVQQAAKYDEFELVGDVLVAKANDGTSTHEVNLEPLLASHGARLDTTIARVDDLFLFEETLRDESTLVDAVRIDTETEATNYAFALTGTPAPTTDVNRGITVVAAGVGGDPDLTLTFKLSDLLARNRVTGVGVGLTPGNAMLITGEGADDRGVYLGTDSAGAWYFGARTGSRQVYTVSVFDHELDIEDFARKSSTARVPVAKLPPGIGGGAAVAAATQAEAEAGTETALRRWSPLRIRQGAQASVLEQARLGSVQEWPANKLPYATTGGADGIIGTNDYQKLSGIETGATRDTPSSIKADYEGNADTNAFTNAEKTKLAGVASGATANSDAQIEGVVRSLERQIDSVLSVALNGTTDTRTNDFYIGPRLVDTTNLGTFVLGGQTYTLRRMQYDSSDRAFTVYMTTAANNQVDLDRLRHYTIGLTKPNGSEQRFAFGHAESSPGGNLQWTWSGVAVSPISAAAGNSNAVVVYEPLAEENFVPETDTAGQILRSQANDVAEWEALATAAEMDAGTAGKVPDAAQAKRYTDAAISAIPAPSVSTGVSVLSLHDGAVATGLAVSSPTASIRPLSLFDPEGSGTVYDMDDLDKTSGVVEIEFELTMASASQTSIGFDTNTADPQRTIRISGFTFVSRLKRLFAFNAGSQARWLTTGAQIGPRITVYNGSGEVGYVYFILAHNANNELGFTYLYIPDATPGSLSFTFSATLEAVVIHNDLQAEAVANLADTRANLPNPNQAAGSGLAVGTLATLIGGNRTPLEGTSFFAVGRGPAGSRNWTCIGGGTGDLIDRLLDFPQANRWYYIGTGSGEGLLAAAPAGDTEANQEVFRWDTRYRYAELGFGGSASVVAFANLFRVALAEITALPSTAGNVAIRQADRLTIAIPSAGTGPDREFYLGRQEVVEAVSRADGSTFNRTYHRLLIGTSNAAEDARNFTARWHA